MKRLFGCLVGARLGLAAAVFSGMLWMGCGGGDPLVPDGDADRLDLDSNQAWTGCEEPGCRGLMFLPGGKLSIVQRAYDGPADWRTVGKGGYKLRRDTVEISGSDYSGKWAFDTYAGGDSLRLTSTDDGHTLSFKKTDGVDVANPGTGGSLAVDPGQAWISEDEEKGYVFSPDRTVLFLTQDSDGDWIVRAEGVYTVSGGDITMDMGFFGITSGIYSVSETGNTLMITIQEYDTDEFYIKTFGLNIETRRAR